MERFFESSERELMWEDPRDAESISGLGSAREWEAAKLEDESRKTKLCAFNVLFMYLF